MDERSPSASELIGAYRRERVLSSAAHERIRARLAVSLDEPAEPRRRVLPLRARWGIPVALVLAAAAMIALASRDATTPRRVADARADQASFGSRGSDEARAVVPVAVPPAIAPRPATNDVVVPQPPGDTVTRAEARREDAPADARGDSGLAEELALVRAARAAIDAGDGETALARLAEHARRFTDGQLAIDRQALRVEALCKAGKGAQARAEATLFERAHPGSSHVEHVRRVCRE